MRFLPSKTDRKVFGQIAEEYDLVYFGDVDPRVDTEYKVVKGLVAAPNIRDENYTTGNVYDYEVAFLQRARSVILNNQQKAKRRWTILQIQLKTAFLPHFVVDGRSRSEEYGSLLVEALRMGEIGWQHLAGGGNFPQVFATYARPEFVAIVSQILTPETQAMLATHFAMFDYEFDGDKLLIYATNQAIDLQMLDHMLRVGLWLARYLDQIYQKPQIENPQA